MSKSIKKTPIGGHTKKESEKKWKRFQNRRLRRLINANIKNAEEILFLTLRDISNIWDAPKDGKSYWKSHEKKWLRK